MNVLDLIRKFEGFRESPYWDVNAYRAGYGSDTTTGEDGSVVRITPGMVINRASADRDLLRRVGTEFEPIARRAVGESAWSALNDGQRAALTSIAYNYGRIPDTVSKAVASGDAGRASSAIAALGSHNGGINAARRLLEADLFANGGKADGAAQSDSNAMVKAPQNSLSIMSVGLDPAAFMRPANALSMVPLSYTRKNYLGSLS